MSAGGYIYVLGEQAISVFATLSSKEQQALLDFFRSLAAHPSQQGDLLVTRDQREQHLLEHGRFLVTYWPDHAVKEVRISELAWS